MTLRDDIISHCDSIIIAFYSWLILILQMGPQIFLHNLILTRSYTGMRESYIEKEPLLKGPTEFKTYRVNNE